MAMLKNNLITIVIVLLAIIGLAFMQYKAGHKEGYSVVYMSTGEVYVGHLSTFPSFELTDGYIFQTTKDATDPAKTNFQLQPLNQVLWGTDKLNLNEKNISFYAELLPTSKIAEALAAKAK